MLTKILRIILETDYKSIFASFLYLSTEVIHNAQFVDSYIYRPEGRGSRDSSCVKAANCNLRQFYRNFELLGNLEKKLQSHLCQFSFFNIAEKILSL